MFTIRRRWRAETSICPILRNRTPPVLCSRSRTAAARCAASALSRSPEDTSAVRTFDDILREAEVLVARGYREDRADRREYRAICGMTRPDFCALLRRLDQVDRPRTYPYLIDRANHGQRRTDLISWPHPKNSVPISIFLCRAETTRYPTGHESAPYGHRPTAS